MDIRLANKEDLEDILKLYEEARIFMRENGNDKQWINYPIKKDIEDDMKKEALYVCTDKEEILGVFFYEFADEKTYKYIKGTWIDDSPYAVVHRLATKRNTNGIGSYILDYAYNLSGNLRIDTHKDNKPMLSLLNKLGFTECGIIYLDNNDERVAFQKRKECRF